MSYSRWLGSKWYIYWHSNLARSRNGQELAIWYVADPKLPTYTYKQLKKDPEAAWADINTRVEAEDRATFDQCVHEFLKNVEERYKR